MSRSERRGGDIDSISIVIPTLDEAARLPTTLDGLAQLDRRLVREWEVIVSDDGSTDDTAGLARERADRDPRFRLLVGDRNRGKGAALAAGFRAARGDTVLFLDADLPVPLETIATMSEAIRGADLVLGSRRIRRSEIATPQPLVRRAGGTAFLLAIKALGFGTVTDPQCGVKLLRRHALAPVVASCTCERFAFDVELIARAEHAGMRIVEVPVAWRHVEGSTMRPIRDAVVTLNDLARLRRRLRSTTPRPT